MSKSHGDHFDYNVRQWTIDSAVEINKKGTPAEKIIADAQKFYGYLFPENGKVEQIKPKRKRKK